MPRIRTLKAEFFRDEDVSCGLVAKVLAAGLICAIADDEGRFKASVPYLRGEVFTHDLVTDDEVGEALTLLDRAGFLQIYTKEGRSYGHIRTWGEHQRVPPTHFKESKFPPPPNTKGAFRRKTKNLVTKTNGFARKSSRAPENGGEKKRREENGGDARALAPAGEGQIIPFDRIDLLVDGCRGLLKRDLKTIERSVVMGWAELERDGDLVSTDEILRLVQHLLQKPTRDGTLPGGLAYCNDSVLALARGRVVRAAASVKAGAVDERVHELMGGTA